jgi:hypothetical protein
MVPVLSLQSRSIAAASSMAERWVTSTPARASSTAPGLGQLGGQGIWVVVDPNGVQGLAGHSAPNDDAAASVQVDADVL